MSKYVFTYDSKFLAFLVFVINKHNPVAITYLVVNFYLNFPGNVNFSLVAKKPYNTVDNSILLSVQFSYLKEITHRKLLRDTFT